MKDLLKQLVNIDPCFDTEILGFFANYTVYRCASGHYGVLVETYTECKYFTGFKNIVSVKYFILTQEMIIV